VNTGNLEVDWMLTTAEREFYDVWFREDCGFEATYATPLSHERGITYDHYAKMYPFYVETWRRIGEWPDGFPPVPPNPTPPCPWASREEFEARLEELASVERSTLG
jgi:hypothetical protein